MAKNYSNENELAGGKITISEEGIDATKEKLAGLREEVKKLEHQVNALAGGGSGAGGTVAGPSMTAAPAGGTGAAGGFAGLGARMAGLGQAAGGIGVIAIAVKEITQAIALTGIEIDKLETKLSRIRSEGASSTFGTARDARTASAAAVGLPASVVTGRGTHVQNLNDSISSAIAAAEDEVNRARESENTYGQNLGRAVTRTIVPDSAVRSAPFLDPTRAARLAADDNLRMTVREQENARLRFIDAARSADAWETVNALSAVRGQLRR